MDQDREKKLTKAKLALTQHMMNIADDLNMSPEEILALLAFMTGGAVAMQDQRKMTPAQAMEVVYRNLEAGNRSAVAAMISAGGRAQ